VLWECHSGEAGGHFVGKSTATKVLQARLWWSMVFKDAKEYARGRNLCQSVGRSSHRDELRLQPVCALHIFDKRVVNFIGPINLAARHSRAKYIIIATEYLGRWAEEALVKECTMDTSTRFIFENIISRFGCPKSLTSD